MVVEGYAAAGGFVFGRRTYELLASYWPNAPKEEEAVTVPLNTLPKYVASTTLGETLVWSGSKLLGEDIPKAVAALKQEDGKDLHVVGSGELMQTLIEHDLVDAFRVMIDPILVGGGKRVFRDDGVLRSLRLVEGQVTTTGAFLATYATNEGWSGRSITGSRGAASTVDADGRTLVRSPSFVGRMGDSTRCVRRPRP